MKFNVSRLKNLISLSGLVGLLSLAACTNSRQLATVQTVNLDQYEGKWYDLAHLPQKFQDDCRCVSAEYTRMNDYVQVINTCVDTASGKERDIKGKAFPIEGSNNSELKVQFFWPFKGDYYIIELEPDYTYAMVGSPDRKSLWILGRDPQPDATIIKKYLNRAETLGFDTSQMVFTDQSCNISRDE